MRSSSAQPWLDKQIILMHGAGEAVEELVGLFKEGLQRSENL